MYARRAMPPARHAGHASAARHFKVAGQRQRHGHEKAPAARPGNGHRAADSAGIFTIIAPPAITPPTCQQSAYDAITRARLKTPPYARRRNAPPIAAVAMNAAIRPIISLSGHFGATAFTMRSGFSMPHMRIATCCKAFPPLDRSLIFARHRRVMISTR